MLYFERKLTSIGRSFVVGVDEAGRGPLAGPVVAAAVCLLKKSFKNRIDDSKKLTALQREQAFFEITDNSFFGIGVVNEKVIDRLNILVATRIAMEMAVEELLRKASSPCREKIHILVDGNVKLDLDFEYTNIIKGDSRSKSIASASILAKVTRDRIMNIYNKVFPQYQFDRHKGYPTKAHRSAIKRFGRSMIHRESFLCE